MAAPRNFFDPFFSPDAGKGTTNYDDIDGPSGRIALPASGKLTAPASDQYFQLPVTGQGTVSVRSTAKDLLQIEVQTDLVGSPTFNLILAREEWRMFYKQGDSTTDLSKYAFRNKSERDCWLSQGDDPTVYWLSIDTNNGVFRYGKWYTNTSMILVQLDLKRLDPDPAGKSYVWKDPQRDAFLEDLKTVSVTADGDDVTVPNVVISPLPIVVDLSPFVVPTDTVRLEDLETGHVTVSSNLPAACQQLYANVTGNSIVLDDHDFQEFSQAIQYSCTTPGCWAYKTLEAKAGEFGKKNPEQTYLRITLGYNGGNSPGVPYVMEIWPVGHYSPIHDHGDACAVIKVLHGEINATYYNTLVQADQFEIGTANLVQDQVTWLGEENYQIHKLHNESNDVCVTIQCYAYEKNENQHEDVFSYVDADGKVVPWPPTSDCSFIEFKKLMQEEWKARKQPDGH